MFALYGVAKGLLMITAAAANAASSWLSAVGAKGAANILGVIGAAAEFGVSIIDNIKTILKHKGLQFVKSLLKVGAKAATLASKALTAAGEKVEALALDIASGVADYIADGFETAHKFFRIGSKWAQSFWATAKILRSTAEKSATLNGSDKLAAYLNLAGIVDDVVSFVAEENKFRDGTIKDPDPKIAKDRSRVSKYSQLTNAKFIEKEVKTMSSIFGRIANCIQKCEKEK